VAKEDFCFTYYDGDAARDMAHMNRLERGGYGDLIVSQRKFGHLSLALIKKTLGSDFDVIWDALRIVLKIDSEGNYFIEWLENSVQKMKRQSLKQSENGKKGGRPKAKKKPTQNPTESQSITQEKPLGNGDGNEDEDEFGLNEGGVGETKPTPIVPAMVQQFISEFPNYFADQYSDYPAIREIGEKIFKWQGLSGLVEDTDNTEKVKLRWGELVQHISSHTLYREFDLTRINKHFQSIVQSFNNGTTAHRNGSTGGSNKPGTSDARIQAARDW
jgi:hypothetical protein